MNKTLLFILTLLCVPSAFAQLANPVFSLNSGQYTYALSIALSAPLGANAPPAGYVICYTVDGTTPAASTPGTCGGNGGTTQTYSTPIAIASGYEIISALLTEAGQTNSGVAYNQYTVLASRAAQTWYVRLDGGTRYSSGMTTGQCNGQADASYATAVAAGGGVTTNLPCAFNEVEYLWQDGTYTLGPNAGPTTFPNWGWVIAGGDTVIIRGSIGTDATYRVGWNNPSGAYDATTGHYWGAQGDPYGSGAPPPPSGTSAQHTVIHGENYAACHTASAKTQLHGGYGVSTVLSMVGVSYVDVACLDITDFSNCGKDGQAIGCNSTVGTLSDYAENGIEWYNTSTYDTLTDIHIHGMASVGMVGATGTGTVFSYLDVIGNAGSGWNADDGSGTSGTGTLLVQNFNVAWNGCTEEYPIVDPLPYFDCTDDNTSGYGSAGYGDGFGTATTTSNPGWQVHWDQGNVFYNTQDGLDQLHIYGGDSSTTLTRVLAYGNMGQQLKIGGSTSIIQNSVIISNCNALRQAIPGVPVGYNTLLSDYCRAADAGMLITVNDGSTSIYQNNTYYSASSTGIGMEITDTCTTSTCLIKYDNNIFVGFLNNAADGYPSGGTGEYSNPLYLDDGVSTAFTNAGSSFSNNITFHSNSTWTCPQSYIDETNALCADPQLVDETWHNYSFGNMSPASGGSIALHAGMYLSSLTTDFTGATRANPPSIGGYEAYTAQPLATITVLPIAAATKVDGTVTMTSTCSYTGYTNSGITSGSNPYVPCTATWTDTGAYTTIGSTTGVVTGVSIGSDTVTATISTISGNATVTVASGPTLSAITVTPNPGEVTVGGNITFGAACLYSDGTTTPCNVAWTDTGNNSSIGSTTGIVTGTSVGTDTVTATISTVYGTATVTVTAPPPFARFQGLIRQGKSN